MTEWIRRLHIYTGLFSFTALMLFGAAGLIGACHEDPRAASRPLPVVSELDFEVPQGATDPEVAELVFARLAMRDAAPVPAWALGRNEDHVLVLHFYGPNGVVHASVLEEQKQLHVEIDRSTLGEYANSMHALVLPNAGPQWMVRLWSVYLELSIFTLLFMVVTGVWLWLGTRPRLLWAQAFFAVGTIAFVALYLLGR